MSKVVRCGAPDGDWGKNITHLSEEQFDLCYSEFRKHCMRRLFPGVLRMKPYEQPDRRTHLSDTAPLASLGGAANRGRALLWRFQTSRSD